MANIQWEEQVGYGFGDNASPRDLELLWRQTYQFYEDYYRGYFWTVNPVYDWQITVTPNVSAQGFYNGDLNSHPARDAVIPLYEYNPGSTDPVDKALITLVFPLAKRRWALFATSTKNGLNWSTSYQTRWYNSETNLQVNDVIDVGFATTLGMKSDVYGFPSAFAISTTYAANTYIGICLFNGTQDTPKRMYTQAIIFDVPKFAAYLDENNPDMDFGVWDTDQVSPEAGEASGEGGYSDGTHALWDSDQIDEDPLPTLDGISVGFVHMYAPTAGGLINLGEEIFPDFDFNSVVDPTGNDVVNAILNACSAFVDVFNQIPKMFEMFINSRLIDYVQDCHIVPVVPTTSGTAHIKLGFRELNTTAPVVTSEYVHVDCGDVNIREVYGQFLDYSPFTRAKLFLPFVGFVPIEPEYWQNGTLNVTYKFSVRDGSFMCNVKSTPTRTHGMSKSVIAQYSGTACIHIPLTGLNYSSMISGVVGGVAAAIPAISGGNPAAAAMAALNTAASAPEVQSSNGFTGSSAFLGQRTPFLIIERTAQHYPQKFAHDKGLPSKITTTLGSAKGFVRVKDVDLSEFQATEVEKDEILKLLSEGIYI